MKNPMHSILFTITAALLLLLVAAEPAMANPIAKVKAFFQDGTELFLKYIIPTLATCILAWQGIQVARGAKQFGDVIVVGIGCAMAIGAPLIIAFFQN